MAKQPALGSETRIAPRERAQACNIWYQGGPGCRSYASMPRGLRCEPWSGRAEDIGMNGDNQLHLGVVCCQSVEEAHQTGWAVCVRDAHRTLDRLRTPASGSWRPGTPCRCRGSKCKGDGRCGSEGTRGVWRVVHNGKGSRTRPGGSFLMRSLIAYRPAMRLARVAKKK